MLLPENSLRKVYELLRWSRLSSQFVQKCLQLMLTSSLVGVVVCLGCGLLLKQYVLKLTQLLWVNVVICPLLSLNLSI